VYYLSVKEAIVLEKRNRNLRKSSLVVSKLVPLFLVSFLAATFALLLSPAPSGAQTTAMTIPLDSTEGLSP